MRRRLLLSLCSGLLLLGGAVGAEELLTVGSATLTWTANTEDDLAGYKVYRATTPGGYDTPLISLGLVTSYTFTLPASATDVKYYFTITAYNLDGAESGKSNEVEKLVAGAAVIGIPTNFMAITLMGNTTFMWNPVPGVAGYLLRVHKVGTPYDPCSSMAVCSGLLLTTQKTIALPPGDYDTWVNAANSLTEYGEAQGLLVTVPVNLPPGPPKGLVVK